VRCNRFSSNSLYTHQFDSSQPSFNGDEARSLIVQWQAPYIFSHWFSFSKVKKKYSKRAIYNVYRQPEVVRFHQQKIEELRQREKAL
jgi:hypothetical protein